MEENKEEFRKWLSQILMQEITGDTVFFEGLGLGEEDIELFFHEFVEKYNIDASTFNYRDYSRGTFHFFERWVKKRVVITFNYHHLYEVMKHREWFSPVVLGETQG